jgi:hypothetical protein
VTVFRAILALALACCAGDDEAPAELLAGPPRCPTAGACEPCGVEVGDELVAGGGSPTGPAVRLASMPSADEPGAGGAGGSG